MNKEYGLINLLRYLCRLTAIILGLIAIIGCGDIGGDDNDYFCHPQLVYYTYPEHNEADVQGHRLIYVRFTELMDNSTINQSTFSLEDYTGNIVDGSVYFYDWLPQDCWPWVCAPRAYAKFTPSSNLIPSTRYTATLDSTVQDEEGNSLGCNYSWSFTIKADDGIGFWQAVSTTGAPFEGTAVWTGNSMIVWDGTGGGKYIPDTWQVISTINAPSERNYHTALWTGTEMIVWGGIDSGSGAKLNTGSKYNPITNTWQSTSTINAPSRSGHTAIWTGTEMIVWGGNWNVTYLETGGRYNPSSDSWQETSTTGAPLGRKGHTAVWTGTEMIVWGGYRNSSSPPYLNTGGHYDPSSDSWQETSTIGAPDGREEHTAVWTDTEMIVWGGVTDLEPLERFDIIIYLHTGGVYYPDTNSWQETSTLNAPLGNPDYTAVWTGTEMIVWNGTGGRYTP